jgi:hypothetical protein
MLSTGPLTADLPAASFEEITRVILPPTNHALALEEVPPSAGFP